MGNNNNSAFQAQDPTCFAHVTSPVCPCCVADRRLGGEGGEAAAGAPMKTDYDILKEAYR